MLGGFLLLQSMAGGTGAGLGTYVADALREEGFGGGGGAGAPCINACVWPYESGEVIVQVGWDARQYSTVVGVWACCGKPELRLGDRRLGPGLVQLGAACPCPLCTTAWQLSEPKGLQSTPQTHLPAPTLPQHLPAFPTCAYPPELQHAPHAVAPRRRVGWCDFVGERGAAPRVHAPAQHRAAVVRGRGGLDGS